MPRPQRSARISNAVESLEARLLFAANFVPRSIHGLAIDMTITSATGDYAGSAGLLEFRASPDADTYEFSGAINSSGAFAFNRWSATTAHFNAEHTSNEAYNTNSASINLTFTSPTSGNFELSTLNFYWDFEGTMSGDFEIAGTTRPLVALDEGKLTVSGTIGDDTISVTSSGGNIAVTENNFTTEYSASSVTSIDLSLREGHDMLTVGAGVLGVYCFAGDGLDSLYGGEGADTLTGGAGKDLIDGGLGDDRLNGAGSPDHLIGNAGADRLYGGDGDDFCEGGGGVDRVWGGNGDDLLSGGGSNDKLFGEAGNDTLSGGRGIDLLDGGDETDLATSDGTDSLLNVP